MIKVYHPLKLRPARAWRTYIGGSQIDALHKLPSKGDSNFPEEWIMSTVCARNAGREKYPDEGLSYLEENDITLRDMIASQPEDMLGAEHVARVGNNTGVLVKIIDAGERLTLQAHPTKEKSQELFGSSYGKTECWHILGGRTIEGEEPCIYIGFRPGITRELWKDIFDRQDIPAMLACLHRFNVKPGETYLIQGGIPHAIGAGCLLIEIQEPTDYTIRTERITPAGLHIADFMLHQGLGFERMFEVFSYEGTEKDVAYHSICINPQELNAPEGCHIQELVGYRDTPCFRLVRYDITTSIELATSGSFFGLYLFSGSGILTCGDHTENVVAGDQFFVPAISSPFRLESNQDKPIVAFQCFGPQI